MNGWIRLRVGSDAPGLYPKENEMNDLFRGELVRLTSEEPEFITKYEARWQRDSEFRRLLDSNPADLVSEKKMKESFEKDADGGFNPQRYSFTIRSLADDKPIGFLGLWGNLIHGEFWVGIGIGERDYWNKGCGTDAMKLCLRYAFMELGAQRVSLGLFENNVRALKAYQKVGFRLEGRTRKDMLREGQRHDSIWMGILRDEWFEMQRDGNE
jgi:RimJ/RimL family protein N-acetyltransferase